LQLSCAVAVAAWLLTTDPGASISVPIDKYIEGVPNKIGPPTDLMGTTFEGVMVRQRSVQSTEKIDALKAHFVDSFRKAGLYLAPETAGMKGQAGEQVTGLDAENMITFSVILQPNPKGTTIVVAGADMGHLPILHTNDATGPVYPGATHLMNSSLEGTHLMTYSIVATPAEIKTFYRTEYGKAGYTESEDMVFTRGFDRAQVTVDPGASARTVVVQTGSTKQQQPKAPPHPVMEKIKP
jgi:hypothetical protein